MDIFVTTTTPNLSKCFCLMISKGVLVSIREIRFKNQKATVTFTPTFAYAPKTEIFFFTINSNGFVVSKQITLSLSEKLPNYVRMLYLYPKSRNHNLTCSKLTLRLI
jgi:hypothetical protein